MDASERDALLDCERSYHDHESNPPASSSSSSSSSFASRITTKSLVAGVAGMVLCAYSGHAVKRMLGAGQRGDAPLTNESLVEIYDAITQSRLPGNAERRNDPLLKAAEKDLPNIGIIKSVDPTWQAQSGWYHHPVPGNNAEEGKFVMCVPGEWDNSYTYNFLSLFRSGICIKEVRTDIQNDDFTGCDIRVFNQYAFIWKNDFKIGNQTARSEENFFGPPAKLHPNVVDFYYAHESPDHYGYELRGDTEYSKKSLRNIQYLAWFNGDPDSPHRSSLWYPFGPSIGELLRDYPLFVMPREKRIPVIGWMSKDCVLRERINVLVEISKHFPVFSMGRCEQNIAPPPDDPGRLGDFGDQQKTKAQYMFYYALENGIQCPHYMTEKIWDALSRGSIPIYIGWDGIEEYIPSKDAVIDLRDFSSPAELSAKLTEIATNDAAYAKAHEWRTKSPDQWPLKFRSLIRQVSSDMKFGICSTMKEGPKNHPPAVATEKCDRSVKIMGMPVTEYPGREAAWWEVAGWKVETAHKVDNTAVARVEIQSPMKFLTKRCDEHTIECFHTLKTATAKNVNQQQRNMNNNNGGVRRMENGNNNNQNDNNNNIRNSNVRRMKEKGDMLPDYVSTVDVRKGKNPVHLSNSNGSAHKGESHGREEDYGPVLSKKNSLKTASMGESETQSDENDENEGVETTKSSSKKKHETEEEKKERLKEEKQEKKLAAKIAKREAEALERVHETVADLPVIKDKAPTAPPPPGEARHDVTKTTDDFDAGAPSADKEAEEALKERLALLDEVSSKKSSHRG